MAKDYLNEVKALLNRDLLYNYAETVDIGEASAKALASEIHADLLIIDDAEGISFNGVIPSVKPYILRLF